MIGVPSKGRAGKSPTLASLADRTDVVIAAIPSEEDAYVEAYPNAVILRTEPNVGTARQDLLDFARHYGTGPFWMIDDDILGVYERYDGRHFRPIEISDALTRMESAITEAADDRLALAAPHFRHRAWSGPDVEFNKNLRNWMYVNPAAPFAYWKHLKEDLDAVLQVLLAGWHTMRFNSIAFTAPLMGSLPGGCADDYAAGRLDAACQHLASKYPGIVSLKLSDTTGQLESPVNWREVARRMATA